MANIVGTRVPSVSPPVAPDRRRLDRVLTNLPIRIVSVDGEPTNHPGVCKNLSRGGVGLETSARLKIGGVVEFEFANVVDEPMQYTVRILFRNDRHYGGYYVNEDGSDIRVPN